MNARTTIDRRAKGFPPSAQGMGTDDLARSRPSLFEAGFSRPVVVIRRSAVDHNVGERDISFDEGIPVVLATRSRAGTGGIQALARPFLLLMRKR